jgi:hypothetical protein
LPTHEDTGLWYVHYCDCRACSEIRDGVVTDFDHEDETYDEDYCSECDCSPCECREECHTFGPDETPLMPADKLLLRNPLLSILRKGGRYWSSEMEINGLDPDSAASIAGIPLESYGSKATSDAFICATSDCTVDAEIKIGRIRDGAKQPSDYARSTYDTLRDRGATCAYNAGHHVHVDATRIVDLGQDAVQTVLRASLTLANACEPALLALASSGYPSHRSNHSDNGYAGSLKDSTDAALRSRSAWHSSNAHYAARYGEGHGIPTFEYRLPNGTTEPIRAHAHVAIALGLLDFGERYLDRDADARDFVRRAETRIATHRDYGEADAAAILSRALHLSPSSYRALAIASDTAPASAQHRDVWKLAAA